MYALSGATALTYQIVWYHAIVDQLGASGTTFVIVLCSFIGGLGLGSLVASKVTRWLDQRTERHGLPTFGRIELAVAVSTLLLLIICKLRLALVLGPFPYREVMKSGIHFYAPSLFYQVIKVLLPSLSVGAPCFLMGLTFPYLCSLYRSETRFPSRLYAANTLGACAAVLLSEFVGLEVIGYAGCLGLAAVTSLGISVWAMRQPSSLPLPLPKPVATLRGETPSLFPGIASGLLCGGLQALAFVLIKLTLQDLRTSFALLSFLAIFGIFLASRTVHRFRPGRVILLVASWAGLCFTMLIWWIEPGFSQSVVRGAIRSSLSPFVAGLSSTVLIAAFQIFIPYALWSMLLPDLCDRLQQGGVDLSRAYGLNTVSFLLGVLIFAWVLPFVNFFYAARVFGFLAAALLLVLTVFPWNKPLPRTATLGLGTVACLALLLAPRQLELRLIGGQRERPKALDYRSTPQHLFWVKDMPNGDGRALMFDRHSMSGTAWTSQTYMRQMAHFPLLLLDHPTNALLVCFGVGVTADAIRKHPSVARVDVVDLNPSVYELNNWFAAENGAVLKDPKLRLFADDGRQYLRLTKERYDFATMEPPPPFMPGIARLYSANYYASLKACLSPGAVVSQWLPDRELDQRGVDLIVATFVNAFPNAFLFVGLGRELILVGSDHPFGLGRVAVNFAQRDAVRQDLARFGLVSPDQLLALILRDTESLKTEWQTRRVVQDGFVSLESLVVGIAQAAHPKSQFWAAKSNLFLDRPDVLRRLAETAPGEVGKVKMLWDMPQSDPSYARIVPENYLLNR